MEWMQIVPYIFGFMALAIAGWVAKSIANLGKSVDSMKESLGELNINMAVYMEKFGNLERRVEKLEDENAS